MNYQVSDSAATATALFSGVKTSGYTLGYDSSIDSGDPSSALNATEVVTVLTWAQEAGKSTGLVSTTTVTHATPAALYAHSYTRSWECDADIEDDEKPEGKHDIAWQLVNAMPGG